MGITEAEERGPRAPGVVSKGSSRAPRACKGSWGLPPRPTAPRVVPRKVYSMPIRYRACVHPAPLIQPHSLGTLLSHQLQVPRKTSNLADSLSHPIYAGRL